MQAQVLGHKKDARHVGPCWNLKVLTLTLTIDLELWCNERDFNSFHITWNMSG